MLVGSSVRRWIAAPLAAALLAICSAEAVGLAAAQSPALEASAQEQQFLELLNAFRADPVSQQKAL
ncbi:MAG: hypothetical protein FJX77_13015, partial [Armatimonadetes bacterium]|nr:hypothetical protein [Armatimonadota bacterium]